MSERHDWMLVAPWWRWPRQRAENGLSPRRSRPVLQKYEDPRFVDDFLADPQHALAWNDDDWVYETSVISAATVGGTGPLATKTAELSQPRSMKPPYRFARYVERKTSTRKLFLDTHRRSYLVVCELHCDAPGFPRARRDDVCEAGFVVRRRYLSYPKSAEGAAVGILKQISSLQLELAKLERVPKAKRMLRRYESFPPPNANGAVSAKKRELERALILERKKLRRWAGENDLSEGALGWIASERKQVGQWVVVEDEPEKLLEDSYPLYPLIPAPDDDRNSGKDATVYFGVVPTGGSDHDLAGRPRYDDQTLYEIRCFVRRHKPGCPRTGEPNDCNGELFWSPPTEAYRLAAHFDPVGTAHRPVHVQLPDFPALAAAAAARPVGALSPIAMSQPPQSSLKMGPGVPPKTGSVGPGQICFLAIPLVTIVAWFVLNIFLPIVMLLFGLWFLLRLKFCIPPSVSISAALQVQLEATVEAGAAAEVGAGALALHAKVKGAAVELMGAQDDQPTKDVLEELSNVPLAQLGTDLSRPKKGPDFNAGIVWEERVEREQAVALV